VTGQRGGGTERYTTAAAFPRHELDNDFLPRLWASRKLGELTRQIRLNGAHPELVEEVRRTALRYGLLSEYTSYLVLEPDAVVASGGDGAIDLAAAAPASMTGQAAVAAAQQSRREREVRSLRDVDSAQNAVALDAAVISGRADGMARTVAGRMFAFRNDAWTDVRHDPTNGTIDVKPFGPAYFALLRALPELEAYWSAMPSVLVAGAAVNVRVSDEGAERLSAAEIARIASAFRARESR
jgi:Ca-activated chloride channel family protein